MKGKIVKVGETFVFQYKKPNKPVTFQVPIHPDDLDKVFLYNLPDVEVECEIVTKNYKNTFNMTDEDNKETGELNSITKEFAKIKSIGTEDWDDIYRLFWEETKKPRITVEDIKEGLFDFPTWLLENYEPPIRKK